MASATAKKIRQTPGFAYVGSYTGFSDEKQLRWVGSKTPGKGITIFEYDEKEGKLQKTNHAVVEQDSPTWLEVHPSGRFLVAVHELSHHLGTPKGVGFLTSYEIQGDGGLKKICTQETKGNGNTCAAFDKSGKFVLVTRYWEGGISVLPFNESDGTIGPVCAAPQHEGCGPHKLRQSSSHPHGVHGSPTTDMVFAMDLGTDYVHQYTLDVKTGALQHLSNVHMGEESGPRGMVFHPNLQIAYVNNELSGTVVACAISNLKGLEPVQTISCYPEEFICEGHEHNFGFAKFWGAEMVITKSGKFLYAICRVHHSLAIFRTNADGTLAEAGRQALADLSNARNLTLDTSGDFVLVASQDANLVECFRINHITGLLSRTDTADAPCAADVAVV
eukprot:m.49435 g.49435  ORF g.49435 m.49435 type:complete len:389 (+) comp21021_c1_seq1:13-1179(+)